MAKMTRYLAGRMVQALITLFIVTSIIFLLFEAMPGDPLDKFRSDPTVTESQLERWSQQFGLDEPGHVRYFKFMGNMFTGQFGESWSKNKPVWDILSDRAPRTLLLFGTATVVSYFLGVMIGSYIAWRRGGFAEGAAISGSLFFYNMPSFWIGLIMIWLFSHYITLFPLGNFSDINETAEFFGITGNEWFAGALDWLWHMTLPLIVMVMIGVAGIILLMRTSLLEVMKEDYILTAKAKGLPEGKVRKKHANRNAYLPIVTSFTLSMATAVGGAVILEQVFSYRGMGMLYLEALYSQDQFLAGATLFILSLLVIFANIVADILYGVLDPRVRL